MLAAASVASGHTGVPVPRTGPEPSDIALFLLAAFALWFVRRALRRRGSRGGSTDPPARRPRQG